MKVISAKNITWTKEFTCNQCAAVLEVSSGDLFILDDSTGENGNYWKPNVYFKCPVCESNNCVTGKIPSGLQSRLFSEATSKASL